VPELPELEVLKEILERRVLHRPIVTARAWRPGLVKTLSPSLDALSGEAFVAIERRGKHLIFSLRNDLHLVVHLMLAGRFVLCASATRPTKATALFVRFGDAQDLRLIENGPVKRTRAYIVTDPGEVREVVKAGVEPLSPEFTLDAFAERIAGRRIQVKKLLTDPRRIAGIGSAYADEILFRARMSPVHYASTLDPEEIAALHAAIVSVLSEGVAALRARTGDDPFADEIRDFMQVVKRTGKPCPRCGTRIQEIRYAQTRTYYCPACQSGGATLRDRRAWLTR
jgi:formamidopyrimidine-DNA glycosylase